MGQERSAYPTMHVSTTDPSKDTSRSGQRMSSSNIGNDLERLTHGLMGSISALLMCEHMISRELASTSELATNATLQTSLELLKETVDQIHGYGDHLMQVSNRYKQVNSEA